MPLEKGMKKKGGRKKGSLNKNTEVAHAFINYLVGKGHKEADLIWEELKAKEKMDALTKLMDFVVPKQARVENVNKQLPNLTINFLPATPERLAEQNTLDITHEEIEPTDSD